MSCSRCRVQKESSRCSSCRRTDTKKNTTCQGGHTCKASCKADCSKLQAGDKVIICKVPCTSVKGDTNESCSDSPTCTGASSKAPCESTDTLTSCRMRPSKVSMEPLQEVDEECGGPICNEGAQLQHPCHHQHPEGYTCTRDRFAFIPAPISLQQEDDTVVKKLICLILLLIFMYALYNWQKDQ